MAGLDYWLIDIHHVQIAMPPGEEDAASRFYGGVLGMERVPKPPPLAERGGAWFRSQGVELHLGVEREFRPARKAHPAMVVSDLDRLRERLGEHRVAIQEDEQLEGYERFFVNDPFGNRLELLGER